MVKKRKVLHAVNQLLGLSGTRHLDGDNLMKLFLERHEDLQLSECKPKELLKLYILYKVPARAKDAYQMLVAKVLRDVRRQQTSCVAAGAEKEGVSTGVGECSSNLSLAQGVRKLTVKDLERLLTWFCSKADSCGCDGLPFVRGELQGLVSAVGGGGTGFEFIDDMVMWKEDYEDIVHLVEESILDKSFVRMKSFVHHFCFECISFNTDSKTLLMLSQRFTLLFVILCSLGHCQLDLHTVIEILVKCMALLFETAKFLKGRHDDIIRMYADKLIGDVIIPKIERTLTLNKKELGGESLYLKSLEMCKHVVVHKDSVVSLQEIESFIKMCP